MNLLDHSKLTKKISSYFKHAEKNQSGQILVIFLLILVVGLAITLSIASRTITNVRQSTSSDESNKAYFAAEAGVESALKKIEGNSAPGGTTFSINFTSTNNSQSNVLVRNLCDSTAGQIPCLGVFKFPGSVQRDDVSQISLIQTFNDPLGVPTTAGTGSSLLNTDSIAFYWDDGTSGTSFQSGTSTPAIEVTLLTCTTCSATPSWNIYKYTFDSYAASRNPTNNFCAAAVSTTPVTKTDQDGNAFPYKYSATFQFNVNPAGCNNDVATGNPVLARIRILYSPVAIPLAVAGVSKALPTQGQVITSSGVTPSGVTRKLQVTHLWPALPAIFDYVLYNGGASVLTK